MTQWLLLPVKLSIVPVDTASQPIGECCYAILVVDSGSSCVVDFWLTNLVPDASTYCLAFYNALFHPAAPKWPLRGIPENVALPTQFADDTALCKAAAYLMVGVRGIENVEDELKSRKAIRTLLREIQSLHKPPLISTRRRGPMQHYTIVEAERTIRTWLYNRSFADHQVKLAPPTLRKYGVVLPGYNTPAAGWLLPVIGSTRTIRDGIELEKLVYSNPEAGIEPGIDVQVRSLPAQFGRAQGVFIEYTSGLLTYLRLVPR